MTAEEQEKLQAAIHWMDTMKERLDHYEVHRNEFLSDMRLPPRNVKFLREVLLPFCENTLLLDNIAKSEGLCYEPGGIRNRLRIIVRVEHCSKLEEVKTSYPNELVDMSGNNGISYPDNFPYLLKHSAYKPAQGQTKEENTLTEALNGRIPKANGDADPDFVICLPHEHTIYSILENVIRNSAKHNAHKFKKHTEQQNGKEVDVEAKDLDIHVDITDAGPDHFHCTIYDNVSLVGLGKLTDLLNKKSDRLLQDGRPNRANMGMADMKINAFLLQKASDFTESMLNDALDIVAFERTAMANGSDWSFADALWAVRPGAENAINKYKWEGNNDVLDGQLDSGEYALGYRFKLTKAKKVAWIGKQPEGAAGKPTEDDYKKEGVHHFFDKDGKTAWQNYAASLSDTLAAYEIAVLEKGVWDEWEKEWKNESERKADNTEQQGYNWNKWLHLRLAKLPFRVLVIGEGTVAAPFKRRVVNATIGCDSSAGSVLMSALDAWVKGKHGLGADEHIFLRAVLIDQGNGTPPKARRTRSVDAQVCLLNADDIIVWPDNETVAPVDCIVQKGRLAVIDHHGNIAKAGMVTANGHANAEAIKRELICWGCLWNGYTYVDKASRDYDHVRSTLGGKEMKDVAVCDMADLLLRKVVVLDERFGGVASEPVPAKDARVRPYDQWGYWAAANMYVATKLTGAKEPIEFQAHSDSATSLEFNINKRAKKVDLIIKPKEVAGAPGETIAQEHGSLQSLLVPFVDTLVIHRTYWLSFDDEERKILFDTFGEIILTSGAGKPENADGVKYISFVTFSMLARSPLLAKLALTKTLGGLVSKPY